MLKVVPETREGSEQFRISHNELRNLYRQHRRLRWPEKWLKWKYKAGIEDSGEKPLLKCVPVRSRRIQKINIIWGY
jgi:hypothetical protein